DVQVSVQRGIGGQDGEELPGCVDADVLEEIGHRHKHAAALGHAYFLPAAHQVHHLQVDDLQGVRVKSKGSQRRLEAHVVAVMVAAQQIDQVMVPALELVHVVGHVGDDVGEVPVPFYQHAVLVVPKRGAAQPDGPV